MRTAQKILALGTVLATATPALANPNDQPAPAPIAAPAIPKKWDAKAQAKQAVIKIGDMPYLVTLGAAPVMVSDAEFGRYIGETEPLTGARGPACGNVLSKSEGDCQRARRVALERRKAEQLAMEKAAKAKANKPVKPTL
jgi:hypothetical protein